MLSACFVLFFAAPNNTPALIQEIVRSGRVQEIAVPLSERIEPPVEIAPGAPPVLSFRSLDGQLRQRFNNMDLVMDDAGH